MRKVVITGAAGFIGGALTRRLLQMGVIVHGVDTSMEKLNEFARNENFIPIVADFSLYKNLATLIGTDDDFDVFYHFAWQGVFGNAFNDYELQLNNAKYACIALEQAIAINARKFIFAGTKNEIEIQRLVKLDNIAPRNTCIYATAKQAAEMICKTIAYQKGINYSSGLIAMAYGENNNSQMLVNVVIENLLRGIRPKLAIGLQPYDLIYISDIVDAFIAIGEHGRNMKSYYVGHRTLETFRDSVTRMRDAISPEMKLKFGEYPDSTDIDYSDVDLNALFNDTGFECKSDFNESIQSTACWIALRIGKENIAMMKLNPSLRNKLLSMYRWGGVNNNLCCPRLAA